MARLFTHTEGSEVKIDIGKTLAGTLIGLALVAAAVFLWANGQEVPAGAVWTLGEAVIVGVLGITLGEQAK